LNIYENRPNDIALHRTMNLWLIY